MSSKHSWDFFSKDYEDTVFSVTSSRPRRKMFLKFLKYPLVLNLGAGPLPYMNQEMIRAGFKIVANDISRKMIKESSNRFSNQNLYFVNANNLNLPFKSNSFNSVLAINSILPENRKKIDLMLLECLRVLRKFGKFVGFFPAWETSIKAKEHLGLVEKLDEKLIRVYETTGWQCYQTHDTLSNHLKNVGFSKYVVKRILLKSKAEIESMKAIYSINTQNCLMFEYLAIAEK